MCVGQQRCIDDQGNECDQIHRLVRTGPECIPIAIVAGDAARHAGVRFYEPGAPTGKRVAVIEGSIQEGGLELVYPEAIRVKFWKVSEAVVALQAARGRPLLELFALPPRPETGAARAMLNGRLERIESPLEKGRKLLEEAIAIDPSHEEARLYLAFLHGHEGKRLLAAEEYLEIFQTAIDDANRGHAAIQRIFEHMFVSLDEPRFVIHDAVVQGDQCFLRWDFTARSQSSEAWKIEGIARPCE